MENQHGNQNVSNTPLVIPSAGNEGDVATLSQTLESITIGKGDLSGVFPLSVPTMSATASGTGLQIQNVYSLSDPFHSSSSKPKARKKTRGKTPGRIKPQLVSKQTISNKSLGEYKDSQSIEFLQTYIPELMCEYMQVYKQEPKKVEEISQLLQAAQRTLNQIVAWEGPPVVVDENVNEEDLKSHIAFVSEMRKDLQLLRYFTPWLVKEEDLVNCTKYTQVLEDLIPKFESVTSLPKVESVQQANEATGWVLGLMTGEIKLKDPRKEGGWKNEGPTPARSKSASKVIPVQPPAPASLQDLQKYTPQVLRQMYTLGKKTVLTSQEKALHKTCRMNLNSALDDLNNIVRWRQEPSRRHRSGAAGTVKEVIQKITTANKLREAQMVYQILEPFIMEKMLWENMSKQNADLQWFCKKGLKRLNFPQNHCGK